MTLSWTMDKLGPITRSAEDAALVFGVIHGRDPSDPASVTRPFDWPGKGTLADLTVGYTDTGRMADERPELKALKGLGVTLVPIDLPAPPSLAALRLILEAECAAAFDDLPRQGVADGYGKVWGTTFRAGQFVTAVEYLRAMRLRTLLMREMAGVMGKVNLYVCPAGSDLLLTNMTGHPTVCVPNGVRKAGGADLPVGLTFTGRLYGEAELLAVAKAYQEATGHHLRRPPMERVTKENAGVK
jgi:Asp-tRNA(Asn)/Glu-tRNA(Gln) amidotransferase A subunit family amidase